MGYSNSQRINLFFLLDGTHTPGHLILHPSPVLFTKLNPTHRTKAHNGNESDTPSSSDDKAYGKEGEIGSWEDERCRSSS
jgi:hypothetical protein